MSAYVADISTAPRPELIIFDCDGVLVDSEPLSLAALGEFKQTALKFRKTSNKGRIRNTHGTYLVCTSNCWKMPLPGFFSFDGGPFLAASEKFDVSDKRVVDSMGLMPPKNLG